MDKKAISVARRVAALGALVLLTGCGSSSQSGRSPDPRQLALRLSDLPSGATAGPARYWNNRQAAARDGLPASQYDRHGRIRSYADTFDRSLINGLVARGLVRADSQVTEYRDQSGARWEFSRLRTTFARGGVLGATTGGTRVGEAVHLFHYHGASAPPVGEEDAVFRAESAGDEFAYTTWTILFRRSRWVATVRAVGLQGQLPLSRAMRLARNVDGRIRQSA